MSPKLTLKNEIPLKTENHIARLDYTILVSTASFLFLILETSESIQEKDSWVQEQSGDQFSLLFAWSQLWAIQSLEAK